MAAHPAGEGPRILTRVHRVDHQARLEPDEGSARAPVEPRRRRSCALDARVSRTDPTARRTTIVTHGLGELIGDASPGEHEYLFPEWSGAYFIDGLNAEVEFGVPKETSSPPRTSSRSKPITCCSMVSTFGDARTSFRNGACL